MTQQRLQEFSPSEGVLYIGKPFPWLTRAMVMSNHYYFYVVVEDFGPMFTKFASYTARVCLNGHEYAKRQLTKEGIAFEARDNGVLACAEPARLQQILDALDEHKIEGVVRKWQARLPDPFTAADHAAGFNTQLSILQAEFSGAQVFDRPLSGRHPFAEIVFENIDLWRPSKVGLILQRRVTKRAPGNRPFPRHYPKGHPLAAIRLQILQDRELSSKPYVPRPRSTTATTSASDGS